MLNRAEIETRIALIDSIVYRLEARIEQQDKKLEKIIAIIDKLSSAIEQMAQGEGGETSYRT